MKSSFTTALVVQINAMVALSADDATALHEALKDAPYGEDGIQKIMRAIDAKIQHVPCLRGKPNKGGTKGQQFLKKVWNYPIQDEWDVLLDPKKSFCTKASTIVHRMNLVGCSHPDEQTIKWMLALLLMVCHEELPDPRVRLDKLNDLKALVVSERKHYPLQHLAEFPEKPEQLPQDMFQHAYPDVKPVPKEFAGITAIGDKGIPLRKNSNLLKRKAVEADDKMGWAAVRSLVKSEMEAASKQPCSTAASSKVMPMLEVGQAPPPQSTDPDELELYAEYCRKLQELRARKSTCASPVGMAGNELGPVKPEPDHKIPLQLTATGDGKWQLTPKCRTFEPPENIINHEGVQVKDEGDTSAAADDDADALDAFAKASLDAFKKRKAKGVQKKPAEAKPIKAKGEKVKAELAEVSKKDIMQSMPKVGPDGAPPVRYNGGVIYTALTTCSFRVLTTRGDKYSEKGCGKWGGKEPTKAAWTAAIKAIDDARAAEK